MSVKPARDVEAGKLITYPDKDMPNLYRVRYNKGLGSVPDALSGLFSSRTAAKKQIYFYENRPKPQAIEYTHQKNISDEEEAKMFEEVKKQVEAENNGKEKIKKTKSKCRAE